MERKKNLFPSQNSSLISDQNKLVQNCSLVFMLKGFSSSELAAQPQTKLFFLEPLNQNAQPQTLQTAALSFRRILVLHHPRPCRRPSAGQRLTQARLPPFSFSHPLPPPPKANVSPPPPEAARGSPRGKRHRARRRRHHHTPPWRPPPPGTEHPVTYSSHQGPAPVRAAERGGGREETLSVAPNASGPPPPLSPKGRGRGREGGAPPSRRREAGPRARRGRRYLSTSGSGAGPARRGGCVTLPEGVRGRSAPVIVLRRPLFPPPLPPLPLPSPALRGAAGGQAATQRARRRGGAEVGGKREVPAKAPDGSGAAARWPLTVSNLSAAPALTAGRGERARAPRRSEREPGRGRPWPTRISSSISSSGTQVSGGGGEARPPRQRRGGGAKGEREREGAGGAESKGPAPRSHFRSAGVVDVVALARRGGSPPPPLPPARLRAGPRPGPRPASR